MIISLPFYISNFLSCFVRGKAARHKFRGSVNSFLYRPLVARFIKQTFGESVTNVKFVRQHTMGRCVCVVNDKYFVKIFRSMSGARLKNFEFLVNHIAQFMDIDIPRIYVAKNNHMYVTEKANGFGIYDFDRKFVIQHEKKILNQVDEIISVLQSIDVKKLPDANRFCVALESTSKDIKPEPITQESVLSHGDLNVRNFLFDKDLNICGLIDFDGMRITNNGEYDKQIFMKYWNRYKVSKRNNPAE